MKTSFSDKKIKIDFPEENQSIIVKGNSLLLEVFNNILINAAKFTRSQEVKIEINILMDSNEHYKLEFKDYGPGIEDRMKFKIFDRASRADHDMWGTGLGLTLVKKVVESLGGDIHVEDRVEGDRTKGSNFVLLLQRGDNSG